MRKLLFMVIFFSMIAIGITALPRSSYATDNNQNHKWEEIDSTSKGKDCGNIKILTEKLVVDHGYIIRTIVVTRRGCSVTQTFVVTNHYKEKGSGI